MREMTKDRALVGVVTALALLVLAVGCGLVSDQGRQEAKKVEAKGQQARQKAKKKVEDLQKKVESRGQQARQEVKKKVEAGQEDLKKKVDDLQKKVDELLKKVEAQEQQDQKK